MTTENVSNLIINKLSQAQYNNAKSAGTLKSTELYLITPGTEYIIAGQMSGTTLGERATAEGYNTTASGYCSHAEGNNTKASMASTHAGGEYTVAQHVAASAHGSHTKTGRAGQFVVGQYNIGKSDTLFEVGSGSKSGAGDRTNAFEVYAADGAKVYGNMSATTFTATSDARLKKNIVDYTPVNSILDLPVKEFDYIKSDIHTIGCLAQDLQKICPEIVTEDSEGYLSIQENKLVYLLLLEVKKLKEEIAELKK